MTKKGTRHLLILQWSSSADCSNINKSSPAVSSLTDYGRRSQSAYVRRAGQKAGQVAIPVGNKGDYLSKLAIKDPREDINNIQFV